MVDDENYFSIYRKCYSDENSRLVIIDEGEKAEKVIMPFDGWTI